MKIWKAVFFNLLFISVISAFLSMGCNSVKIKQQGSVTVENMDGTRRTESRKYRVKTLSDGIFTAYRKNFHVTIPPGSEAELDFGVGNYELHKGTIIVSTASEYADQTVFVRYFLVNQWGGCQFMRLRLPESYRSPESDCEIVYNLLEGKNYSIKPKLHYLYSDQGNNHYYGFFIPYGVFSKVEDITISILIKRDEETSARIEVNKKITSKEFEYYKLFFQPKKSKELKKTRQKGNYREEHAQRKKIWQEAGGVYYFEDGFDYPLETSERLTSDFGVLREWYLSGGTFFSKSTHMGVDYGRPTGTKIVASAGGIVRYVKNGAYVGNTVIIEHGLGLYTDYSHMDTVLVKEGQVVKKGEQIGTVGMTGAATGAHLHWGARVYGFAVDPRSFFGIEEIFNSF